MSKLQSFLMHQKLRFYQTTESFFFEPFVEEKTSIGLNNGESWCSNVLSISRTNNTVALWKPSTDSILNQKLKFNDFEVIFGIFGIIKLIAGKYLVLITDARPVGQFEIASDSDLKVYKIENVKLIAYNPSHIHLTQQQIDYNQKYLCMIEQALKIPNYYFSYRYDLTTGYQRQFLKSVQKSLFEVATAEFVWNRALLLDDLASFPEFCLPIVCGFVSIHTSNFKHRKFQWILISRRSTRRAGTRWFTRGIDPSGAVANYIETEQLLLTDKDQFSFVQIRGSMPFFWSQLPNLKYKPSFVVPRSASHIESYALHMRSLAQQYGRLCIVTLISETGSEGRLLKQFRDLIHEGNFNRSHDVPFVNLESFDFHAKCRQGGWESLSKLMNQITSYIEEYSYYRSTMNFSQASFHQIKTQQGIIRTNCIDSLDRTNVVQSLIAKQVLRDMMIESELLTQFEKLDDKAEFISVYRNAWADNADVCSIQYAGTGALKSDYTRTGQRRLMGVLSDGLNSLIRYYKNNFEDGFRQDSIDLILGKYKVIENEEGKQIKCPLENRNVWKIFSLPILFILSLAMFLMALLLMIFSYSEFNLEQGFYSLFWFSMSSICWLIMYYLGNEFADYPTLVRRR